MDPKTSQRIFELARDQQEELEIPDDDEEVEDDGKVQFLRPQGRAMDEDEEELDDMGSDEEERELDEENFVRCTLLTSLPNTRSSMEQGYRSCGLRDSRRSAPLEFHGTPDPCRYHFREVGERRGDKRCCR